jgi:hypothetical protein
MSKDGKTEKWIGLFLMATSGGAVLSLSKQMIDGGAIPYILATVLFFGGSYFYYRGRQRVAKSKAEGILSDSKPTVLYLRPFDTDAKTMHATFNRFVTEEEQLAEVFKPFGKLIAIGQPGESLPRPGGVRLYVSNDEWNNVVESKMREARLVILRAGKGEGIMWEVKQGVQIVNPAKFLVLVLNMKAGDYESFCRETESIFPESLPSGIESRFGRLSGFVRFMPNWEAEFLPIVSTSFLRTPPYKKLKSSFILALKPVFEDFDIPWQRPTISIPIILSLLFFLLLIIAIIGSLWP